MSAESEFENLQNLAINQIGEYLVQAPTYRVIMDPIYLLVLFAELDYIAQLGQ